MLFEVDQSLFKPEQTAIVTSLGIQSFNVGIASAGVEGHTDASGSEEHNDRLSQARALSVAVPLRDTGIELATARAFERGKAFPANDSTSIAGRADNRRVVIIGTP